jgi:hypothetical protein
MEAVVQSRMTERAAMKNETGPIDLSRCDVDMLRRASVAEFKSQSVTVERNCYAIEWISMPPRARFRREQQSSYRSRSTVMKRSSTT